MADGGFTFTQGVSSPQQSSQGGGGGGGGGDFSDTIFKASALMENKKKEAMRQYELAQGYLREDLKTVHGFDTTVGGMGQFSQGLNEAAEFARQEIKNANDPVKAQEIIAAFKEQYNAVKARQDSVRNKQTMFNAAVTATGSEVEALNQGLGIDSEYVLPEASDAALAQQAWDNPYEGGIQVIDGRMMAIDPSDGQLKDIGQIEATLNTSMYDLQTKPIEAGAIRDWAKSAGVYTDIGWNAGYWNKDRAGQLYDDNILQTGRKEDKTEMGEYHRRQVLNTLEDRGMIDIFSNEDRVNFVAGNFDALDPSKTEKVISMGRDIFIKESRISKDEALANKGRGAGSKNVADPFTGYDTEAYKGAMELETPDVATGETTMDYNITGLPKPIKVQGSDFGGNIGEYTIFGFGVDPNGNQVARIKRKEKVVKHTYIDKDGNTQFADSAEEAIAAVSKINEEAGGAVAIYDGETEEYTREKPETIKVNQGGEGLDGEVWSRIFSDDPVALTLLKQQQDVANLSILNEVREAAKVSGVSSAFTGMFPDEITRFD